MKVYLKPWCPWCVDAEHWLKAGGYAYEALDVTTDAAAYARMKEISGQTKAPTLELEDGTVLADFDTRQLEEFLKVHKIRPS